MKIRKEIIIDAPIEFAWLQIGPEFASSAAWGSIISSSKPIEGAGPSGAACAGRVCQTNNGMGSFTETLEMYSDADKELVYSATGDKMPGFVKSLTNHWKLEPLGQKQTILRCLLEIKIGFPFNIFPGPMMKMQMSKMLLMGLEELKHYIEYGKPHPRKTETFQKAVA